MSDRGKGTKVYVGNLNVDCNERDLRDTFDRFGRLNDVWVARKPPGFGFVWYDDPRDADDAVRELDDRELLGKRMRVELSSSRGPGARGGPGGGSASECYECGGRGHFARECPRRRGGGGYGGARRRSPSPYRGGGGGRYGRSRSRSRSPRRSRSRSPRRRSPSPRRRSRTRSRSPVRRSPSPARGASPRRSASPARNRSPSPRRSRSPVRRSPSPRRED